ncbi:MAG: Holliday junction branch migration protein RuvA [Actinomycetes bacterium]
MIASISGLVMANTGSTATVEIGGVGLQIQISPRISVGLAVGERVHLFTSLMVREDSLTLFGFESQEAKDFFELLQTVTGIGPKVAQAALSVFDVNDLAHAIVNDDGGRLEKIPGLGKKGAARVLLELKEKAAPYLGIARAPAVAEQSWRIPVETGLANLGFSPRESKESVDALAREVGETGESMELSALLRRALQMRGQGR